MTIRTFAIDRRDGGVEIMHIYDDDSSPARQIAKWHTDRQAEVISASATQISLAVIPADRSARNRWARRGTSITIRPAQIRG